MCIDQPTNNKNNIKTIETHSTLQILIHVPRQKPEIIPQKCKNSKIPQKHEKLLQIPHFK